MDRKELLVGFWDGFVVWWSLDTLDMCLGDRTLTLESVTLSKSLFTTRHIQSRKSVWKLSLERSANCGLWVHHVNTLLNH